MTPTFLLDTSALIAHFRAEVGGEAVQAMLQEPSAHVAISAVSLLEFRRRLIDLGVSPAAADATTSSYASMMTSIVAVDAAVAMPGRYPKPRPRVCPRWTR